MVKPEFKWFAIKVAAGAAAAAFVHGVTFLFLGGPLPYLVPGILVACAVYFAFIDRTPLEHGRFAKRGVALLFAAFALWLAAPPSEGAVIPWQPYDPTLLEAARKGERPVMIEFITQSCPYCRQMDRNVFSRQKVARAAEPFLALRADLTAATPQNQQLAQQFAIEAFPTIVFLGPNGQERVNLRLVGFERAENFVQRLEQAR